MAAVMIRIPAAAFSSGGAFFGQPEHKVKYLINSSTESAPHIAHGAWFNGRDGYAQPPNSKTISVMGTSPSWFNSPEAFNDLPLAEIRSQIANEVERGILEVLNSNGSTATATQIRAGSVT